MNNPVSAEGVLPTGGNGAAQQAPVPPVQPPKKEAIVAANEFDGKLTLRRPIVANGETVGELIFREPTAGDIERLGNPVTIAMYENNPKVHFESQTMTMMMALLAGVPPSTIRGMHPKDWNNGAWKLANFFMPDLYL